MTRGNIKPESWRDFDADAARATPRILGMGLGVFVFVIVLIVLAGAFTWFWAPWKGKVEQRQMTEGSGAYRIAAYDAFYDDCQNIVAKEQIIANYEAELSGDPKPDKARAATLQAAITAETNARLELIASYNADSRKADTRANFKASDLPYQIDPTQETTCDA